MEAKISEYQLIPESQDQQDIDLFSEPLMDRKEAAAFLKVSPGTLAVWDCIKRYELYPIKVGSRVRYSRTNLRRFLMEQLKAK